jgi:ankyrin repeat protein
VPEKRHALHWAARNGHVALCSWLLDQNVDVNVPTVDGTTALGWAAWQGHVATVEFLLARGAQPHGFNVCGCNAMHWACQGPREDAALQVFRVLQQASVSCAALNSNGHSCLHKAAQRGHRRLCEVLISEGGLGSGQMQPDWGEGCRPSQLAALGGHLALAAWLGEIQNTHEDTRRDSDEKCKMVMVHRLK